MGGISSEAVLRRLQDVRNISQESIETISLWIMHYKDKNSIDVIVNGWLTCFQKASSDQQRIALFYIMNDVVQKAKNKHIDYLIPAFQPAVLAAVQIGRNSKQVKLTMERCIGIFGDRQVFAKESVQAMNNIISNTDATDGDDICVDLDVDELIRKLNIFQKGRELVECAFHILRNSNLNFQESNKKARDRHEVTVLENETKEATKQLNSFRHVMELQKKKMLLLVEMLEIAKRQFSHQLRDVTVAEDAYQKFYQGVRVVKTELKEMEKTGVYPAATPPRDAPSPTPNDDIYAIGVEHVLQNLREPIRDNHDMADMDIGDEDDDIVNTVPSVSNNPMLNIVQYPPYGGQWNGRENGLPNPTTVSLNQGNFVPNTYYKGNYNDVSVSSNADENDKEFPSYRYDRGREQWKSRNGNLDRTWSNKRNDRGWKGGGGRGKRDHRGHYGRHGSYGGSDRRNGGRWYQMQTSGLRVDQDI